MTIVVLRLLVSPTLFCLRGTKKKEFSSVYTAAFIHSLFDDYMTLVCLLTIYDFVAHVDFYVEYIILCESGLYWLLLLLRNSQMDALIILFLATVKK